MIKCFQNRMDSVSLAEPRRRQKWTLNPRGNLWANDESKFGQKLMEKMGWEKGIIGLTSKARAFPTSLSSLVARSSGAPNKLFSAVNLDNCHLKMGWKKECLLDTLNLKSMIMKMGWQKTSILP